jgi:competence protein ComEC
MLVTLLCIGLISIGQRCRAPQQHCLMTFAYVCIGLLLGLMWANARAAWVLQDHLAKALEGKDMKVIGVVHGLPEQLQAGTRFDFHIERVLAAPCCHQAIPKHVRLSWYQGSAYGRQTINHRVPNDLALVQPGERWQMTVRLKRPHGNANPMGFDAELRAMAQGIRAQGSVRDHHKSQSKPYRLKPVGFSMAHIVTVLRTKIRTYIHTILVDREYAGVITALVVGDQKAITPQSWDVFRQTGVSHLVAISGLHITLVAGSLSGLLAALWRRSFWTRAQLPLIIPVPKIKIAFAVLIAGLYVALAGFGVPAQRAFIMLSVMAYATWRARKTPMSYVLTIALFFVLVMDPWAVLSAGFWLSFGAVAIILYVNAGRKFTTYAGNPQVVVTSKYLQSMRYIKRLVCNASRTQYAVTLGLLPLTVLLFGQFSVISPLANAIAIPVVTMIVAPLALIGVVLPHPLAELLLVSAEAVMGVLVHALTYLANLPFAVWRMPMPDGWMIAVASLGTLLLLAPKGWPLRWLGGVGFLPLALNTATRPEANGLNMTAFDVGQGMAVLIETANHRLLYDTGAAQSEQMDTGKRILLPYFAARGIQTLDKLIVSHSDLDHTGGALSLMSEMTVKRVESSLFADHAIVRAAAAHQSCVRGQRWVWDGVVFTYYHPTEAILADDHQKPNARSCVLHIEVANRKILLAGDIEAAQEKLLLKTHANEALNADVLLVPHHGSGTSSTLGFLKAVNPAIAIFQMGYLNQFKHPKPAVWQRYGDLGATRYRSDVDGAVSIAISSLGVINVDHYRQYHARYWYGK